jgi:hypothetical protein
MSFKLCTSVTFMTVYVVRKELGTMPFLGDCSMHIYDVRACLCSHTTIQASARLSFFLRSHAYSVPRNFLSWTASISAMKMNPAVYRSKELMMFLQGHWFYVANILLCDENFSCSLRFICHHLTYDHPAGTGSSG